MADVTAALPGVTVEARMHGREPRVAVDTVEPEPADPAPVAEEADGTARVTPAARVRQGARRGRRRPGRRVRQLLAGPRRRPGARPAPRPGSSRGGRRITGYARG